MERGGQDQVRGGFVEQQDTKRKLGGAAERLALRCPTAAATNKAAAAGAAIQLRRRHNKDTCQGQRVTAQR